MTEREAMTQVHTDEAPFIAGEFLTQKEAEEEFGTDWNPPYCWPGALRPSEEEEHEWLKKLGLMD